MSSTATTERFLARRGFTLVELLVVLIIVALVLSLSLPAIRQSMKIDDQNHNKARIRWARGRAALDGEPQSLTFQSEDGNAFIMALPDGSLLGTSSAAFASMSGSWSNAGAAALRIPSPGSRDCSRDSEHRRSNDC